jgi:tetratricopeptide (TPR) repeat protein
MRAALEWGLDHHPESALHLAAIFCIVSGLVTNVTEALRLLKKALDQVRSLPPVEGEADQRRQRFIALALFAQGLVGMGAFGSPQVLQSFQEAISISRATGDKRILGYSLEMYYAASRYNDIPDGLTAAEEGLAIFNEIGDWWGLYMANMNMALVASKRGAFEEKQKYLEVTKDRLQGAPLSIQSGLFYLTMGIDERFQGNLEIARQHFENGLDVFRQLKSKNFIYVMQSELGHLARAEGDLLQAKDIYRKTILGWQELGVRPAIAHQLECFAAIALAEENPRRALKLFGAAEALRDRVQSPMTTQERQEYDQSVARLHAMVPEAEFSALWAKGRALTMDEAIELALNCAAYPDEVAPAAPGAG